MDFLMVLFWSYWFPLLVVLVLVLLGVFMRAIRWRN
jgi:CHASE1-domain containing sensor protein